MAGVLKFCPKCREENLEPWYGYYPFMDDNAICKKHFENMETIDISKDDYFVILSISHDVIFLEAMIKLKQENIIEYETKMAQFRIQANQQKIAQSNNENQLRCPTCNSTNIKRISGTAKAVGAVAFGLFSKTARSQFKCVNCGYKW